MTDDDRRSAETRRSSRTSSASDRATVLRWIALLSPLVVPWVVIRTAETTLLFPWGTIVVESEQLVPIWAFFGQPGPTAEHIERWPLGSLCYAFALCWAATRRFGTDQRVTAGLLALVAIVVASVSSGFGVDPNTTTVPLGSAYALGLAVWIYYRR